MYFEFVDWDDVYHKRVRAPYIPTIEHETDLRNFDDTFVCMAPKLSIPKQRLDNSIQQFFIGYSFSEKLPSRSSSSSRFTNRKSITSSLAGIQGSRNSMILPGYDKEDYEYNEGFGNISSGNTIKTIASDDISEYELDIYNQNYPKLILGDNSAKYRNSYQNPRISQLMDED